MNVLLYLFVHDNIDDRVPHHRALGELQRQDSEVDGDGGGHAQDATHGHDSVGTPAEEEHKHENTNLIVIVIVIIYISDDVNIYVNIRRSKEG